MSEKGPEQKEKTTSSENAGYESMGRLMSGMMNMCCKGEFSDCSEMMKKYMDPAENHSLHKSQETKYKSDEKKR